jgi:hypothetical protein
MADETHTPFTADERLDGVTEERLATLLRDLSGRRAALRAELDRLEESLERIEVELARRGAGG